MTGLELLKILHVTAALLSIGGFALRSWWLIGGNPLLQTPLVKRLPHVIDTLLLGSAVAMLWLWRLPPWESPWLIAKIIALLVYIGLGMVALRFGRTQVIRRGAAGLAVITALYIVSVALTKSAWGVLALLQS